MDESVWVSVKQGWIASSTSIASDVIPTNISTWTKDELANCNWNVKVHMPFLWLFSPKSLNGCLCVRLQRSLVHIRNYT